ncbi:MAG: gluconate 2-dehydrogenase subunit 3 family protein [Rhodospirillaceae bacterium]|nr:gluconate 2-dehydrogenase subunit 3 family protein [Rhodospirillaceae bacterium]
MRTIDKRLRVSRRRFLASGTATAAGVGAVAGGAVVIAPAGSWAESPANLSPEAASTLLKMARDIFPHDALDDSYYQRAIGGYDAEAAEDADLKAMIEDGTAALNTRAQARHGAAYADIENEDDRVGLLHEIETTPLFRKLRADLVVSLYNQTEVWQRLGYEGPSADQGGYINRGFDDLDWL